MKILLVFLFSFSVFSNDLLRNIEDINGESKRLKSKKLALVFINYSEALKTFSVENYFKYKKELIQTVHCIESYDFEESEKKVISQLVKKTMNRKYLKLEKNIKRKLSEDQKNELMLLETSTEKKC